VAQIEAGKRGWNIAAACGRLGSDLPSDRLLRVFVQPRVAVGEVSAIALQNGKTETRLIQSHPVLNEKRNPRVEITDISLEDKVLFGLSRDLSLEVPESLLR